MNTIVGLMTIDFSASLCGKHKDYGLFFLIKDRDDDKNICMIYHNGNIDWINYPEPFKSEEHNIEGTFASKLRNLDELIDNCIYQLNKELNKKR